MSALKFSRGTAPKAPAPTVDASVAFIAPETPCERAWAALCDGEWNPDVERVMASLGGWEALGEGASLTYAAFTAAFNGDPDPARLLFAVGEG